MEPEPAPEPIALRELDEDEGESEDIRRDNIRLVNGINAEMETRLNKIGVYRHEQIANWTPADVKRISAGLDFSGRIEAERWIEQARILTSGTIMQTAEVITSDTPHVTGAKDEPAAPSPSASAGLIPIQEKQMPGKRRMIYSGALSATSPLWEDEDMFLQDFSRPSKPVMEKAPIRRSPNQDVEGDDLKKIKNIGAVHEKKLNAMGISRYEQIAGMSPADLKEIGKRLNISSTTSPEEMMRQARSLSEKV